MNVSATVVIGVLRVNKTVKKIDGGLAILRPFQQFSVKLG